MDLRLTQDDRVAGGSKGRKRKRGTAKSMGTAAASGRAKATKSSRSRGGSRGKARKLTFGRVVFKLFYWGSVLAIWGGIAVAGIVAYYGMQLPAADTWKVPERSPNIRIVAADGQLISNRGKMGGEAVAIDELPYYVAEAVIAIEDERFLSHWGIDPIGIAGAMVDNITGQYKYLRGGSTLTQQVAKNLFLTPDQTLGRKIQEALLALWLERSYTKDQILELYLNRVYFGAGAHGIEAAAQRYFGKSARNLSLGEAAILAGVLQAPSRLSPDRHSEAAAARARIVLSQMAKLGFISPEEAKAAASDPNRHIRTKVAGAEYYVADWVETLIKAYIGDVKEDVVVTTTINWDLQKQGEFLIKEMIASNGPEHQFSQGALVAMDTDGTVRAVVGGADYQQSQFNRAVTARRQPGSAFKPFVYVTAMENGYTPDSVIEDAPFTYKGWSPENYTHKYAGPVRLRDALAHSLNTVSARLTVDVGPQAVVDTALRFGISSQLQPVPSIALGTQEVSLLELTAGYAPFANGGIGVIAHVITRIETARGDVLYSDVPSGPGRVASPEVIGEMNDMLSGAIEVGTAKQASLPGWPIAGKTGTTQSNRDAVFVGYSARMVTGVWLGNDDDTPMKGVGGGSYPAELWSGFMQKAHQGMSVADLPRGGAVPAAPIETPAPQPTEKPRTLMDLFNQLFGG
jgi:penicillin-binding protein 1A